MKFYFANPQPERFVDEVRAIAARGEFDKVETRPVLATFLGRVIAANPARAEAWFADDVFPPAVPTGLQAVFSGPGQKAFIDLVWAPVTDADLAGYNIYRSEGGGPAIKLNVELVRAPAYRDANVQAGKHYSYSVSSVDQRGNESGRSEEASEAVP